MGNTKEIVLQALASRRSLKPKHLGTPAPNKEELSKLVQTAMRVPDHNQSTPYRFVVIEDEDRGELARLYEQAAESLGADEEKAAKARSKAFKGPMIVAFIVRRTLLDEQSSFEALLTAGAALGQFMQALAAAGFGGIVLSGSLLADAGLQSAFCQDKTEKLVAWITIGTPSPDAPQPAVEDRAPVLSSWKSCANAMRP